MLKYFTEQRKLISDYLESRKDECITAQEIADALSLTVSKSAVYRNLAALEQEGKVVRVTLAGGRSFGYRYAGSHACAGKIHISCVRCGKTEHVSSRTATAFEQALATEDGFSLNKSECLLYGICKSCRGGAAK